MYVIPKAYYIKHGRSYIVAICQNVGVQHGKHG